MHDTSRNGENLHEDDLYKHNINKHSCTHLSLPKHQVYKIFEYLTKWHTKSYQHMEGPSTFTNYVKATLNYGSTIMEVDRGGNPDPNDTLSGSMLKQVVRGAHETHQNEPNAFTNLVRTTFSHELSPSEVDWGDPKGEPIKLGPMLNEVDWGDKLRTNSVVNWVAHETHQNEHSTTKVHLGGYDTGINPMDGYSISEVDWGAHD